MCGRAIIARGRGLAKAEYDAFGIDMNESRGRFNESADMVINALSSGVIEGKGPHYPQLKTTLRPAPSPERPWDDRLFAAAIARKSVVEGKSVSVRLDLGGRRVIKKKNRITQ